MKHCRRFQHTHLTVEHLEDRCMPSADLVAQPLGALSAHPLDVGGNPAAPFTPAQIRQAYGFNLVGDGTGQTIAIVDAYHDPNIVSDVNTFINTFMSWEGASLPASFATPASNFLTVQPYTQTVNTGWALETALDVEWAHAIAPGANILLVEAKSASITDLIAAVDYARTQNVVAVSMSWGGSQYLGTSYDSHFTTPSGHTGITFVASSGDSHVVGWPAVSPNVLSVGGTSLTLADGTGTYGSESAWKSSGGGKAAFVAEPAYQKILNISTGGKRGNPDVALVADPNTGVYVYDSNNGAYWYEVGGTSASAPMWAGLTAIADQARGTTGSLDGRSQTLYALYNMAKSSYGTYFHDVGTTGYDFYTGIGTPKVSQVVAGLVSWNGSGSTGTLSNNAVTQGGAGATKHLELVEIQFGAVAPAPVTPTPFVLSELSFGPPPVTNPAPAVQARLDALMRGISEAPAPSIPVASAFFASRTVVGGMDAPDNYLRDADTRLAGIRLGPVDDSPSDIGVQWFAPSTGGGALAPPAVVPPSETGDTVRGLGIVPMQTGAEAYLAASKWNSDPGSTREQTPIYGNDVSVSQSAAGMVLLGAVLSGRRRAKSADEEE
jgi:hypothetical protein